MKKLGLLDVLEGIEDNRRTLAEKVYPTEKRATGCLRLPIYRHADRHRAAAHSFVDCMKNAFDTIGGVVAIDGKQARRTKDQNKRPLHVVSALYKNL